MFVLYLDSECIVSCKMDLRYFEQLIELAKRDIVKIYVHEFVIKELKNRIFRELYQPYAEAKKAADAWGVTTSYKISEEDFLKMISLEVDLFFNSLTPYQIKYDPKISKSVFRDYFEATNAFTHNIYDKSAREGAKKNCIDSVLAHSYASHFENLNKTSSAILITRNVKHFKWISPNIAIEESVSVFLNKYNEIIQKTLAKKNTNVFLNQETAIFLNDNALMTRIKRKIIKMIDSGRVECFYFESYTIPWATDNSIMGHISGYFRKAKIEIKKGYEIFIESNSNRIKLNLPFTAHYRTIIEYMASIALLYKYNIIESRNNFEFKTKDKKYDISNDIRIESNSILISHMAELALHGYIIVTLYRKNTKLEFKIDITEILENQTEIKDF